MRVYDLDPHVHYGGSSVKGWLLLLMLNALVFAGIFYYVIRAVRLFKDAAGAEKVDPENSDLPTLLEWLGLGAPTPERLSGPASNSAGE